MSNTRPLLSFSQIINLNIGFLGIQYSFGLQQTAINPIYSYLGADPAQIPLLNLAGPMTGLFIQPIIGSMSDRTWSPRWGRRKPYFLIGAIFCSLCLFLYPFCSQLWMAAGLLWILDAANNTAMEPYRAFIADHLDTTQQSTGFLAQSFFTGLGITLANFSLYFLQKFDTSTTQQALSIPTWVYGAFFIGGFVSIGSVLFSTRKIQETPPSDEELKEINEYKFNLISIFKEIILAIKEMPKPMWFLAIVYLFQWYALFIYWQFNTLCVAESVFSTQDVTSDLYDQAVGWSGFMNGTYNVITFLSAFVILKLAHKYKAEWVHFAALIIGGLGLMVLPFLKDQDLTLFPMFTLGIAWASIMGVPYIFIVKWLPKNKYGVYMGIINMMIVIPMLIQTLTFRFIYEHFLKSKPTLAILLAGAMMCFAGVLTAVLFGRMNHKTVES